MCGDTPQASVLLPISSTSPMAARDWARRTGCTSHALEVLDDALLLISELVTNSVKHGGPPIVLAIDCDGDGLHVRVRDGSTDVPVPRQSDEDSEDGRGMTLVDLLTRLVAPAR